MAELDVDNLISDFARFYILTILYEGPTHGYAIIRKFQSRVGKKISPGLVYPFLQHLEERGLAGQNSEMVGEKERKVHYLTEEGKALCNRLFQRFARLVTVAIEPSLDVCAHCGCKIYEGGHREVVKEEELVFCCTHCAASYMCEMND
jgi:DNA-binding PadR family transcriptional regulator